MALVPRHSQMWEPMCGFYRKELKTELDNFLKTSNKSFQEFLLTIEVEALNIDKKTSLMLLNCNYPQDLE